MPSRKNSPTKKTAPFVRIFCEGEVTERLYFKGFTQECRLSDADPQQPNDYSPMGLVKAAIKEQKQARKDGYKEDDIHLWVVMDKDQHEDIEKAIHLAQKNNIQIAFSNLCFEYWLLLHFEYTTACENSCDDTIKKLQKHQPEYSKNKHFKVYELFREHLNTACKHAEKCRASQAEICDMERFWEVEPYTDVDKCIDALFALRPRE